LRTQQHWAEALRILLIIGLAAYFRLVNHPHTPGWYTDEGTHLDIAQNMARGRIQYMALNQSMMVVAKLPLFEGILAGLLYLFEGGMTTLRLLSGSLGLVTVGLLYLTVRQTIGKNLALLAAFIHTIYPDAILYSRFGFSYNLLAPLLLITYWGLWRYCQATISLARQRVSLLVAAIALGLGTTCDLWMFIPMGPFILVVLNQNWRDLWWSLPILSLPFGIYSLIMFTLSPQAFWFDIHFTLFLINHLSWVDQWRTLINNSTVLMTQNSWIVLGVIGLFLLSQKQARALLLLIVLFQIIVLGRKVALYNLSFYYLIPVLPLISIGVAVFIKHSLHYGQQQLTEMFETLLARWTQLIKYNIPLQRYLISGGSGLLLTWLIITPLISITLTNVHRIQHGYPTEIDPFLLNPEHTQQAAEFINHHLQTETTVIASPGLAWLIQGKVADFQMSAAYTGQRTVHLPPNLPPDRFAFNPHYQQATFVVVDNLWHNWAVWNIAGVSDMLTTLNSWPIVFEAGEIIIYQNPKMAE